MTDTTAIDDIPAVGPTVEEPVEEVVTIVEEILAGPEAAAEVPEASVEEPEVPAEEPGATAEAPEVPTEPVGVPPEGLAAFEPPAADLSSKQIADTMAAQDPQGVALLETEQAIERAVDAPEAHAVSEPQPLLDQKVDAASVPTGPIGHLKQAAVDTKHKAKTTADNTAAATIPGPTPPAVPGRPGAPSLASKTSRKLVNAKRTVGRRVYPTLLRTSMPKEVVPLVQQLRKEKKSGEDVTKLVNLCMLAIGK